MDGELGNRQGGRHDPLGHRGNEKWEKSLKSSRTSVGVGTVRGEKREVRRIGVFIPGRKPIIENEKKIVEW